MIRYWTSDLHLGHHNIIRYCQRPFENADIMNARLLAEANMRVKDTDSCMHLGDFCYGKGATEYFDALSGTWVLIRGNHDRNNKVKVVADHGFARLGKYRVFFSHEPYYYIDIQGQGTSKLHDSLVDHINAHCNLALCGHVHNNWKISWSGKIPTINVGVDMWDYRPVSDEELINYYEKEVRKHEAKQHKL